MAEETTMTMDDLLHLVPKLITKVNSLETELKQTKLTMGHAIMKLVKKVKKMEVVLKRRHVVLPDSEDEDAENSSKQRRNLQEEEEADISPKGLEVAETLAKVFTQRTKTYIRKVKTGLRMKLDADEDALIAKRMQDELEQSETQKNRMAQVQEAVKYYTEEDWDLVRAKLEASRDLSSKVLSIDFSSDDFAKKMKLSQLKKLKPDELKEEFDKCVEMVEKFIPMNSKLEAPKLKRAGINVQAKVSKKQKITDVPDVTKVKSVRREEEFKVQQPILRYNKRKSLARKGLQKNKSKSARFDTEEDLKAYMDERVDETSSEEFQMGSIPQGSAPAKSVKWQIIKTGLLNDLTRDDLKELYRLMMLKYEDSRPEEEYEREAHNEDTQKNLKFTSEDQVRGGLLGIIVNRLKSGSYRVKSGRHNNGRWEYDIWAWRWQAETLNILTMDVWEEEYFHQYLLQKFMLLKRKDKQKEPFLLMAISQKEHLEKISGMDDAEKKIVARKPRSRTRKLTSTQNSSASAQNVALFSHSKSSTNKVKEGTSRGQMMERSESPFYQDQGAGKTRKSRSELNQKCFADCVGVVIGSYNSRTLEDRGIFDREMSGHLTGNKDSPGCDFE
ncbi:hypothetical protein Tco_1447922 [Tanacetum coccineum]